MSTYYKKIERFFYKKTGKIIALVNNPIKSFNEVEMLFKDNIDGRITKDTFPKRILQGLRIIEFFKSSAKTVSEVLTEMETAGYIPAPVQYFVKSNINPPSPLIICLDPKVTLPDDRIVTINYTFEEPLLDAHPKSFLGQYGSEWYAVIAK